MKFKIAKKFGIKIIQNVEMRLYFITIKHFYYVIIINLLTQRYNIAHQISFTLLP